MILTIGAIAMMTIGGLVQDGGRETYLSYFQGTYAQSGQCDQLTTVWTFSPREITQGQLTCETFKFTDLNGAVRIETRNCSEGGKAVPAVTYRLDLVSTEVIKAFDGQQTTMLRQCPGF